MNSLFLMARSRLVCGAAVVAALALLCGASVAAASSLTDSAASRAAKRAAAHHVQRVGISSSSRDWGAFCLQWAHGSYSCTVSMRGGQCHGLVVVYGSREHPRTRGVRISCSE